MFSDYLIRSFINHVANLPPFWREYQGVLYTSKIHQQLVMLSMKYWSIRQIKRWTLSLQSTINIETKQHSQLKGCVNCDDDLSTLPLKRWARYEYICSTWKCKLLADPTTNTALRIRTFIFKIPFSSVHYIALNLTPLFLSKTFEIKFAFKQRLKTLINHCSGQSSLSQWNYFSIATNVSYTPRLRNSTQIPL